MKIVVADPSMPAMMVETAVRKTPIAVMVYG
jgi:hypothetical protein